MASAEQPQSPAHGPSNEPPILTLSRKLAVRQFRTSDAEQVAKHSNDKVMWLHGPDAVPHPFTLTDAQAYITKSLDISRWHPSGPSWAGPTLPILYAITQNDVVIGSIGFSAGEDVRARGVTIGYWIGREFWGKGIATEVVGAFVEWIWERFPKIVRVEAEVYEFNGQSGRVLGKVGFVHEGTLRGAVWKDGKVAGLEVWGMVRKGL
jgi:[ribosomal protein S5]-alanine N-acetyltransferase